MRNAKVGERAAAAVLFAKGIIIGTNRCQFIQNDTVFQSTFFKIQFVESEYVYYMYSQCSIGKVKAVEEVGTI